PLLSLHDALPICECKDAGQAGEAPLRRDSRKCRAPSERRRKHAGVAKPRPQPAVVVSGGLQPQHAAAAAAPLARSPETTRRKPSLEINHTPQQCDLPALGWPKIRVCPRRAAI